MKRLLITVLMLSGFFTIASAEVGVKLGVSAQIGSMEASGTESSSAGTSETSKVQKTLFATGGYFIEKDFAFLPGRAGELGSRLSIGYDNIVHDLNMGTADNARVQTGTVAAGDIVESTTHKLDAKITGFETVYATLRITDWLYLKAGNVTVDVATQFTGSATSSYATNHELDGDVIGFGIVKSTENGWFTRLEYNDYSIDGKSVINGGTDSVFTAKLNNVSGETTRLSFGKAF